MAVSSYSNDASRPASLHHRPTYVSERKHAFHTSRTPYVACGAFVTSVIAIMACILILRYSDGQNIETWPTAKYPVQPSVMLSIAAVVANTAIRFLFDESSIITWWRKAQRGTTVGDLHRTWEFSNNIASCFTAGKHFNFLALGSLLVSIVSIDGPLLQKSSSVVTESTKGASMVQLQLASNMSIFNHTTGYYTGRAPNIGIISAEFQSVVKAYNARNAISANYTGCLNSCTADVIAPGLDAQCNVTQTPLNINHTIAGTTDLFAVSLDFAGTFNADYMRLNVTARQTNNSDMLTTHDCLLHLATIRYPVTLSANTISLRAQTRNETEKWTYLRQETSGFGTFPSSLGGLYLVAARKYTSAASVYFQGQYELDSTGSTAVEYLDTSSGGNYSWHDPTPDILSALRELMFRTAVTSTATPENGTTQLLASTDTFTRAVYSSRYDYLGYAILVMAVTIIGTSVNMYGFWELGRVFSLGPFEVASAFNAPFFADCNFATTEDKAFREITSRPIRYGEFVEGPGPGEDQGNGHGNGEVRGLVGAIVKTPGKDQAGQSAFEMPGYRQGPVRARMGMGVPANCHSA